MEEPITNIALNKGQQQAVDAIDGPMLVVAGAGTGKTRVIVERVMRLISSGVKPDAILALTFTEKAAGEMLDRINEVRGGLTLDATIATYNGFGNDLLQRYGAECGLGAIQLLGETGKLVFLREHLDDFELDYFAPVARPDSQLKLLADYASLLKQQLVLPRAYLIYAKQLPASTPEEQLDKRKHEELSHFYDTYIKLCHSNQVIDYDDQLYACIGLLTARPNILKELQERYRYVLVDEFQDTNPMQSALVDLLTGKKQNIMAVGDDDQSIYGWRGATLANILDFKKRYPKATEVTLIENYRSSQSILDAAYRLIQKNNPNRLEVINKLDKHLHAQTNNGPRPKAMHFANLDSELVWVAGDINKRLKAGQDPSTIAILARRNVGVQKVHESLELYDVPHAVAGLTNDIYEQTTVRQLIEVLKTVSDPLDDMALFHTLSGPLFTIESGRLATLSATARREHESLTHILREADDSDITAALDTIEEWRKLATELPVGSVAYHIITDSGWKQRLYTQAEQDNELVLQVQALSKYFKTLKEFERVVDIGSVQNYIMNLPTLRAAGSSFEDVSLDISNSLVNVLSVHRAKGLEWDTVYIVDCTEGSFPLRAFGGGLEIPDALKANRSQADEHMAEERRLMYVAVTRARKELILTHADRQGSGMHRTPSRFISELLGKDSDSALEDEGQQTNLELFAPKASTTNAQLPSQMLQDDHLVLSVSQIDCWLRCPQDFYYQYVLQVPLPPDPALQYGTAIHKAIENLHKARREGKLPSLKDMLEQTQATLPKAGYLSVRSRTRSHEQAMATIKTIYKRFSIDPLPIEAEQAFGVEIPNAALKIVGRIDAVYPLGNGIEIRDFKTGTSVMTAEKAKQRATSSNQLALYALAWSLLHDEMPALLTLDFVETGQIGSVKKQPKSLITLTSKLHDMVESIQQGEFPAGKDHTFCSHSE